MTKDQDQAKSEPVNPTSDHQFMDTGVLHEPPKSPKAPKAEPVAEDRE